MEKEYSFSILIKMEKKELSQLRICVEKTNQKFIEKDGKKFTAAYLKDQVWKNVKEITIQFLEEPSKISWTPIKTLEDAKDSEGKKIEMDPLEKKVREIPIKDAIKQIVRERISPLIGISLEFIENGDGMIRISFNPDSGAWSMIGKQAEGVEKGQATMNLGWMDVGTTIHEFLHALGAIHEHQNPNGEPIDWNKEKVYEWAKTTQGWDEKTTDTNIIDKYSVDQIEGSSFDENSIMLYFFPGFLTKNGRGTHQNLRLAETDIEWLKKIYPGGVGYKFSETKKKKKKIFLIFILIILLIFLIFFGYIGIKYIWKKIIQRKK
jgi:hypothetical protein